MFRSVASVVVLFLPLKGNQFCILFVFTQLKPVFLRTWRGSLSPPGLTQGKMTLSVFFEEIFTRGFRHSDPFCASWPSASPCISCASVPDERVKRCCDHVTGAFSLCAVGPFWVGGWGGGTGVFRRGFWLIPLVAFGYPPHPDFSSSCVPAILVDIWC